MNKSCTARLAITEWAGHVTCMVLYIVTAFSIIHRSLWHTRLYIVWHTRTVSIIILTVEEFIFWSGMLIIILYSYKLCTHGLSRSMPADSAHHNNSLCTSFSFSLIWDARVIITCISQLNWCIWFVTYKHDNKVYTEPNVPWMAYLDLYKVSDHSSEQRKWIGRNV